MYEQFLARLVWEAHNLSIFDVGVIFFVMLVVIAYPAIRTAWNGGSK